MKTVEVYNLDTQQRQTIPLVELSPNMVPVALKDGSGVWIDIRKVNSCSEPKHPTFDKKRRRVIRQIRESLAEVCNRESGDWERSLRCDDHPDREIRIWRWIAFTYTKLVAHTTAASSARKTDLFRLCIRWTLLPSAEAVLATVDLQEMGASEARNVLDSFKLVDPGFFGDAEASAHGVIIDYAVIRSLDDFRQAVAEADIICAVDWNTGQSPCIYGRTVLEEIIRSNVPRALRTAVFAVDFETDQLEHLLAAVKVVKGSYEWGTD